MRKALSARSSSLAVFGFAFLIYGLTVSPGVFGWDSAELTLGVYTQGIVHATGYPLYLVLARLFALLPLGDFAVRVNLFAGLMAACTAALLYATLSELTGHHRLAALGGALLFSFAPLTWSEAVVAEVYSLQTALIAAVLLLLVCWYRTRRTIYGWSIFGGLGLAFANHMSTSLVALVLVPYLLWQTKSWQMRIGYILLMAATSLLPYLYLPLRFAAHPAFNVVGQYFNRDLRYPADLVWMLTGRMFGPEMFAYPLTDWFGQVIWFIGQLWLNFLGVGLFLGGIGIYWLWRNQRTLAILFLLIFSAQVIFFTDYQVFDKDTMFHTAYLYWAVFIGIGCDVLLRSLRPEPRRLLVLLLIGLIGMQIITNWNSAGRRDDRFVSAHTQELFTLLPPNAVLIGPWTTLRPIEYFQIVYHQRTDLHLADTTFTALAERDKLATDDAAPILAALDQYLRQVIDHASGPVYTINDEGMTDAGYKLTRIAPFLYRVEWSQTPTGQFQVP